MQRRADGEGITRDLFRVLIVNRWVNEDKTRGRVVN